MKINDRVFSFTVVLLIITELLVILLSWIIAAAEPAAPIKSLLSDGGLRWMFYSFTESVSSGFVVWVLIYSMVLGCYRECGINKLPKRNLSFRQRLALRTVIAEIILGAVIFLVLTAVPHAVLLGVSGSLFTPRFFYGLIPSLAVFLLVPAITYGSITRRFTSVTMVINSMSHGIASTSRIWLPYFLIMMLVHSVIYVAG